MIVTVFRSRLAPGIQDEYGPVARYMSDLARNIPGYISHKGFAAEDGERVTIVEFESEEALRKWQVHPRHLEAKKLGFTTFFSAFRYQICNVTHARSWERKTQVPVVTPELIERHRQMAHALRDAAIRRAFRRCYSALRTCFRHR